MGWSYICELIKIDNEQERSFYEHECVNAHWDVRSLKRQINTSLYLRLAASTDKQGILALSEKGITVDTPQNTIRSNYILEFLGLLMRKRRLNFMGKKVISVQGRKVFVNFLARF